MFKLSKETEHAVDSASRTLAVVGGVACVALVIAVLALAVAVSNHG
jgi:hypothetical protein